MKIQPTVASALLLMGILGRPAGLAAQNEAPRLILLIVVDQMRADYVDRFRDRYQFGLKRLLEESVHFEQAYHDHAGTTTGPGHASISSGRSPRNSGIVGNAWYDRKEAASLNCVGDSEASSIDSEYPGRSPRNLLVSSLGDWIKAAYPEARVYGASRKDRSAILLAGREADAAYWYDTDGRFISSSYYLSRYPEWVEEFNRQAWPDRFFGSLWELQPDLFQYLNDYSVSTLDQGIFKDQLPRSYGSTGLQPDAAFYADVGDSPLMDEYLGRFAAELIERESLGQDDAVDLLALGFSALDSVGHSFGPNSPEVFSTLMHLDRVLGDLLELVERRVGAARTLVALSADHGVIPIPEDPVLAGVGAGRYTSRDIQCFQQAGQALRESLGEAEWFESGLYLNYRTLGEQDRRRSEVEREVARLLERCDPVERVWTRTLLAGPVPADPMGKLFWNSFSPERSADLVVQLKAWRLGATGRGTSHGSAYPYDRHVPLLLRLPGVSAARVTEQVRTVDVAPTLADWLGIPFPRGLDGHSLRQWTVPAGARSERNGSQ